MSSGLVGRGDAAFHNAQKLGQSVSVRIVFARGRHPIFSDFAHGRPEKTNTSGKLKARNGEQIQGEVSKGAMFGFEQGQLGLDRDEAGCIGHTNLSFGFLTEAKVEAPAVAAKLGRSGGLRLTVNDFPRAA